MLIFQSYGIALKDVTRETERKLRVIEMLWSQFSEVVSIVQIEYGFTAQSGYLDVVKVHCQDYSEDYLYSVAMNSPVACLSDTCKAMIKCREKWG